ncbi:signal recognition particle subunit SRP68 [Chelonus insularis]|uniref:signal recognition particle subunit SRP68 n=1 Tax=Chelonus insularis TaxID=460826 RepID=UPI00158A2706|nr:signal recognition particle subunit SRP68 [Chelonus insularis]
MVVLVKNSDIDDNESENDGANPKEARVYSLEIQKIIKAAQWQHGLRHGDYQRYRGYCSRRLRRLRKVLKVPQGDRRHFKRKDITPTMVNDDKFLQIPLMMAERAWSYASQLKMESNTEPRKKFHLISRLRKAAVYSLQLQELIESINSDARTKLEAQAYVAWMQGSLQLELQLWKEAMTNLKKAQVVYGELALAVSPLEQMIYKSRAEELAPSIRYCAYNVGDSSAIDDLMQMRGQLSSELLMNLDTLIVQTRETQTNVEEINWRGKSCGVAPARVTGLLLADYQLTLTLEKTPTLQAKIGLLEAHLIDCKDAISVVRELYKNELKNKDDKSSAHHLIAYLQYIRLSRTLERNLILIQKIGEESVKVKPQNYVKLYEAVIHNLLQMLKLLDDEEFQREHEAKIKGYSAFRCYYMAQSTENLQMWREALALYDRALEHARNALSKNSSYLPEELKTALNKLERSIEGAQCAVHAQSVLQEEQKNESAAIKQTKSKKPLYDRLHEYREDSSLLSKQPNVFTLPPPMKSIPCKPLFFDLASNMIEFPDLSDKLGDQGKKGQAGLTGFVKGLWEWGYK